MPRILVAEDNEHLVRIYGERLNREGFEVTIAQNGIQAVNLAREERPDVILLDIMLPKMDGYEVLMELKSDPDLEPIPVIVLSNKGWDDEVRRALALGAHSFHSKGITPTTQIVKELREIAGVRKALIVDSIAAVREELAGQLRAVGILAATCPRPFEAVTRCEREAPDVVFLNAGGVGLGVSAVTLLQQLRGSDEGRNVPIVLYGRGTQPTGMIRADRANAWLQAPVDPKDLEIVLGDVLSVPAAG